MNIFITGSSGFIGQNVIRTLAKNYNFTKYIRSSKINITEDVVLHFAGKAHDLRKNSNIQEYYTVNLDLTKEIFDNFLFSNAKVFIVLSSVKDVADKLDYELTENHIPNPITHYGKSKLFAEKYILSKKIPEGKRVYILRPCMIHGPGNKGNLNLLYKFVEKDLPWPLGDFKNVRSFCSIDNLCFVINELIQNSQIPSGIYNLADDNPISTNELIKLISENLGKQTRIWNIPQILIKIIAKLCDLLNLPFNTERLNKLTENFPVSNQKIKKAINKNFPVNSREGLINTFKSFNFNDTFF